MTSWMSGIDPPIYGALVLFWVLWMSNPAETRQQAALVERLLDVDTSRVTVIKIFRPDATFELERKAKGWRIAVPVDTDAYQGDVDRMLRYAKEMEVEEVAARDVRAVGDRQSATFGLDALRLQVVFLGQTSADTIWFGADRSTGNNVQAFVRHSGSRWVLLTPACRHSAFERSLPFETRGSSGMGDRVYASAFLKELDLEIFDVPSPAAASSGD